MTAESENMVNFHDNPGNILFQQAELFEKITQLLSNHPAGKNLAILTNPENLKLAEDEVLVQKLDPENRTLHITPRKISELSLDDVLYASQKHELEGNNVKCFVKDTRVAKCLIRHNSPGTIHVYD